MHSCTGQGCHGCASEAAEVIEKWGCEGVETAGRILAQAGLGDENTAAGMSAAHTARNARGMFPGIEVTGHESVEELQRKVEEFEQKKAEGRLPAGARREVEQARATLKRHGLKR